MERIQGVVFFPKVSEEFGGKNIKFIDRERGVGWVVGKGLECQGWESSDA